MGEHGDRHIILQGRSDLLRLQQHQLQAVFLADGLGDIEVGGEVAALADQLLAAGRIFAGDARGSAQHLVEIDGGGVGEHQLARAHANPGCELVAQTFGQGDPAGLVPRGDQVLAPFLRHHFGARGGGWAPRNCRPGRSRPQAGQSDRAGAQLVLCIQCLAVLQGGHRLPRFSIYVLIAAGADFVCAAASFASN